MALLRSNLPGIIRPDTHLLIAVDFSMAIFLQMLCARAPKAD